MALTSLSPEATLSAVHNEIEEIIGEDIGKRGIAAIKLKDQLGAAASDFLDAKAIVILTGFPCRMNDTPPTESDGPPGAVALALAALKLGKSTAIATDASSAGVMMRCCMALNLPSLGDFAIYSFPPSSEWKDEDTERLQQVVAEYDHAVAIERAGRAVDGSYYTMRALKMDHLVAPIDELLTANCTCGIAAKLAPRDLTAPKSPEISAASGPFPQNGKFVVHASMQTEPVAGLPPVIFSAAGAQISSSEVGIDIPSGHASPQVSSRFSRAESFASLAMFSRTSTGIGDGGNECGMGKVLSAVQAHIPRGATIACTVPADHLITAGVSNWGGWGLCAAVEALVRSKLMDLHTREEAAKGPVPPSASPYRVKRRPSEGGIDYTLRFLVRGEDPGFLLPSEEQERALATAMITAGARDGITGALDGSVDGMPLETHLAVLAKLRSIIQRRFPSA